MARKARTRPQNEPSIVPPSREPLTARTKRQAEYLKLLKGQASQVVAIGPAGTGKTYLPTTVAADLLLDGGIDRIILTRPVIGVDGEELGYFPGDLQTKFGHWTIPLIEALEKRMGKARLRNYLFNGKVEIAPLSTMRGRTFDDAWVILDESQNATVAQMKMLLTRIGERSKIILTGDLHQSDLTGTNGLATVLAMLVEQSLPIPVVTFKDEDVVRSELCKLWVEAFQAHEALHGRK